MESIQVISVDEFWKKHRSETRRIIQEEIQKNSPQKKQDEILLMDDLVTLLGKTKQTLFKWLKDNKLKGHYVNGSLFFMRSEINEMIKQGNIQGRRNQKAKTK